MKNLVRFLFHSLSRAIHVLFGFGPCCRFAPTCSEYSAQAFARYGILRGTYLTFHRLLRCHPFGAAGLDPLPDLRK